MPQIKKITIEELRTKFEIWCGKNGCSTAKWFDQRHESGYENLRVMDNYMGFVAFAEEFGLLKKD